MIEEIDALVKAARNTLVEAERLEALGGPVRANRARQARTHAHLWLLRASELALGEPKLSDQSAS